MDLSILEKILVTLSSVLGVLFLWVTFKSAKFKEFLQEVKKSTEDGTITAEEALAMIVKFFGIFK